MSRLGARGVLPAAARPPAGRRVRFWFDDAPYEGVEGEPLAVALWAAGVRALGWNEGTGAPRGLYCGIGHCFECRVQTEAGPDRRACLEPLRDGLRAWRQAPPPPLDAGGDDA